MESEAERNQQTSSSSPSTSTSSSSSSSKMASVLLHWGKGYYEQGTGLHTFIELSMNKKDKKWIKIDPEHRKPEEYSTFLKALGFKNKSPSGHYHVWLRPTPEILEALQEALVIVEQETKKESDGGEGKDKEEGNRQAKRKGSPVIEVALKSGFDPKAKKGAPQGDEKAGLRSPSRRRSE